MDAKFQGPFLPPTAPWKSKPMQGIQGIYNLKMSS